MGIVLSVMVSLSLTASAGAQPTPTVTVGTWTYNANYDTQHDRFAAANITWEHVRADSVCVVLQDYAETGTLAFPCVNVAKGSGNKYPQNLAVVDLISSSSLISGTQYKMHAMLYKGTSVVATSASVTINGGTDGVLP